MEIVNAPRSRLRFALGLAMSTDIIIIFHSRQIHRQVEFYYFFTIVIGVSSSSFLPLILDHFSI